MFIVLEGLDGAGKSTQIRMLQELFARRGVACRYLHFPRFDAPVFGDLIARFLRGELGTVEAVDPYLVALLFAGDRGDAAAEIRQWLASGEAVVLDRYVYSNVAFQCAKLSSEEERRALKRWILDTEYGYYRLPRPDVSLFLDVPFSFTERRRAREATAITCKGRTTSTRRRSICNSACAGFTSMPRARMRRSASSTAARRTARWRRPNGSFRKSKRRSPRS